MREIYYPDGQVETFRDEPPASGLTELLKGLTPPLEGRARVAYDGEMDFGAPIPVKFNAPLTAWERMLWFFAHYEARVYLSRTHYVDTGVGSLACARNVKLFNTAPAGSVGTIGHWCEFADCDVLVSGEHRNDLPCNITFNTAPLFAQIADAAGLAPRTKPAQPISIGNGVVVSLGAIIRPGVSVGDGAVIGAGAVVTRDVPAFTIVAGSPARKLSDRAHCPPWWDSDPVALLGNLGRLSDPVSPPEPRQPRPRFAFIAEAQRIELIGFVEGEGSGVRPILEAPTKVQAYVAQALATDGPHYCLADCWSD